MCKVTVNALPPLVWLRRAVRRWRARSVRPDRETSTAAPVPAGHVAVRVEGGRFAVRLAHLSHPAFLELLRQAEEEYGFALPCDADRLLDVLRRVSSSSDPEERRRADSRPLLQGMAMEKLVPARDRSVVPTVASLHCTD